MERVGRVGGPLAIIAGLIAGGLMGGGLIACGDAPVRCERGELRYRGRPPPRLFAFDNSCRPDCFSAPAEGGCRADCGDVTVAQPVGQLRNQLHVGGASPAATSDGGGGSATLAGTARDDRVLALVDASSLGDGRALVFEFGFVDESGGQGPMVGQPPAPWGFLAAGRGSYLAGEHRGSARFVVRAGVAVDVDGDGTYDLRPGSGEVAAAQGDVAEATPGRVDILSSENERIRGKFFLAFESPMAQAQGQVEGCFDLRVGEPSTSGDLRRGLGP